MKLWYRKPAQGVVYGARRSPSPLTAQKVETLPHQISHSRQPPSSFPLRQSSRFWIPANLTNSLIPCKESFWQRCPGPFTKKRLTGFKIDVKCHW